MHLRKPYCTLLLHTRMAVLLYVTWDGSWGSQAWSKLYCSQHTKKGESHTILLLFVDVDWQRPNTILLVTIILLKMENATVLLGNSWCGFWMLYSCFSYSILHKYLKQIQTWPQVSIWFCVLYSHCFLTSKVLSLFTHPVWSDLKPFSYFVHFVKSQPDFVQWTMFPFLQRKLQVTHNKSRQ